MLRKFYNKILFIVFLILIVAVSASHATPANVKKDTISEETPPEVKKQIIRLYALATFVNLDAVKKLAASGDDAKYAIPFLIDMLDDKTLIMTYDENAEMRTAIGTFMGEEVAAAVGKIGKPAVEPLIAVLGSGNDTVEKNAIIALGLTKDYRAVEPLLFRVGVKELEDTVIERYAVQALKEITGVDFGNDRMAWNKWWVRNRGKTK